MDLGSVGDNTTQLLCLNLQKCLKQLSCVIKPSELLKCPSISPNDSVPLALKYLNPN